jgi:nucleoside-diphosphate-sugar epimerase
MTLHVIVGAGPVGSATAALLPQAGEQVRVVTRSGGGPSLEGVERVAADATDTDRLAVLAEGAEVLYNCASPAYHRWVSDWPPLARSMLRVAETTGAVLVTMSNLYGYGPSDRPFKESVPLEAAGPKGKVRATVWMEALQAHQGGRVRVTEAWASDYFGPGVGVQSPIGRAIGPVVRGRTVWVFGDPDVPHSWTYVPDIAATLVTLGAYERAWGRPWHVPANPPLTQRQVLCELARLAGRTAPRVRSRGGSQLRAAGIVIPAARELEEVRYQFDQPFVVDSSAYETAFGGQPTPMEPGAGGDLGLGDRPQPPPEKSRR